MEFRYNGQVLGGGGLSGGLVLGGVPLGSILSFMGTKAPDGYLACDGAVYAISAYPALANFFQEQFGSASCFGGDGTETFAVPDLRNLFLRGYHGEAANQLSGEIGVKQTGTTLPTAWIDDKLGYVGGFTNGTGVYGNEELIPGVSKSRLRASGPFTMTENPDVSGYPRFGVRPVNMAVLYCIKAAPDDSQTLGDFHCSNGALEGSK